MVYDSSGAGFFDDFLGGGYEKGIVTGIYGPPGAGKTNLCILAMISTAKTGKKVVFLDTDGGFSLDRFHQIAGESKDVLKHVIFLRPSTFEEQATAIAKLTQLLDDSFGLVVVDPLSNLYRLS